MSRISIPACLLALLAAPVVASAAQLSELPVAPSPGRASAGCLHATGAPGGLAALGPYSRRDSATDLLTVGADGARLAERVSVGRLLDCAAVAEAPGGAAVLAGTVIRREGGQYKREIRAVARDPSAAFGPAAHLADVATRPVAAVAPSGLAVVAWGEIDSVRGATQRVRLRVARRAPGAAFGAPETLVSWRSGMFAELHLTAGIDAAGQATVLWAREVPSPTGSHFHVEVASAAPGAAFTVQRLSTESFLDPPALSVASDGWTLVAHQVGGGDDPAKVFERAPGATQFTAVTLPEPLSNPDSAPAVAVRNGGGAVVAWRTGPFESMSGVDAVTREAAGAFSARTVATPVRTSDLGSSTQDFGFADLFDPLVAPPLDDDDEVGLRAAVAPDGRVLLAWPAPTGRRPLTTSVTRAAIGRLDGAFEAARTIAAPLRETTDIAPLFLADGRAAVAWTDNAVRPADGRLHVAAEGVPAPAAPAAPRLTLSARRLQRLFAADAPRVTARCDRPCDLRATVLGPDGSDGFTALTRLRAGRVRLAPSTVDGIQPGTPRMVRIVVHATTPGGHLTTVRSLRVRVARLPAPPVQTPLGLRARHRGDAIVVTWRTAAPARRQFFIVQGRIARADTEPTDIGAVAVRYGRAHKRFSVRLRPQRPGRYRWVAAFTQGRDGDDSARTPIVRVR